MVSDSEELFNPRWIRVPSAFPINNTTCDVIALFSRPYRQLGPARYCRPCSQAIGSLSAATLQGLNFAYLTASQLAGLSAPTLQAVAVSQLAALSDVQARRDGGQGGVVELCCTRRVP